MLLHHHSLAVVLIKRVCVLADKLDTVLHAKLGKDAAHVRLDGLLAEEEAVGNLRVAQAIAHQDGNLVLARGENGREYASGPSGVCRGIKVDVEEPARALKPRGGVVQLLVRDDGKVELCLELLGVGRVIKDKAVAAPQGNKPCVEKDWYRK